MACDQPEASRIIRVRLAEARGPLVVRCIARWAISALLAVGRVRVGPRHDATLARTLGLVGLASGWTGLTLQAVRAVLTRIARSASRAVVGAGFAGWTRRTGAEPGELTHRTWHALDLRFIRLGAQAARLTASAVAYLVARTDAAEDRPTLKIAPL